jgi:hypothetical protein
MSSAWRAFFCSLPFGLVFTRFEKAIHQTSRKLNQKQPILLRLVAA